MAATLAAAGVSTTVSRTPHATITRTNRRFDRTLVIIWPGFALYVPHDEGKRIPLPHVSHQRLSEPSSSRVTRTLGCETLGIDGRVHPLGAEPSSIVADMECLVGSQAQPG